MHTHVHALKTIFPVEMLRSSKATLSKRNPANDGYIEKFFFYEKNRCLLHLVLPCLPSPVPTEFLKVHICNCDLSYIYLNHHLLLGSFQKTPAGKIMASPLAQPSPLSLQSTLTRSLHTHVFQYLCYSYYLHRSEYIT